MKQEQQGIVIEVKDKIAIVKVARHSDCENCGTCAGGNATMLEVYNDIGAQKGDRVCFEPMKKGMLKAAFIIFWLPIISMFVGSQIGVKIASMSHHYSVLFQVLGALLALGLSIAIIVLYEKNARNNVSRLPKIHKSFGT